MTFELTHLLITAGVSLVVGWLARHKGVSPFPLPPPSIPPLPNLAHHPLLQSLLQQFYIELLKKLQEPQQPTPPQK
jgi:hypothetical protein